ncbi:MAG: hypothetical protein HXS53_07780 [Theionarchaea archaeon]|nr:hypothetical protein [Theionarchaea archaeon]
MEKPVHISNMKWLTLFAFCMVWVGTSGYFSVTQDDSWQWNPAIHGTRIVWEDHRNGNWDIYGYDLTGSREFPIIVEKSPQHDPDIYGTCVVWTDERNGNEDIYFIDLRVNREVCVTSHGDNQRNPALFSHTIVWQDQRNGTWDIYGYDLSTGEEFQITSHEGNQITPSIYETRVVWTDDRNGNDDIYGYDLSTGEEFQITSNPHDQRNPSLFGDLVIWEDYRNGNADIYAFSMSEKTEFYISMNESWQTSPVISHDIVVWIDERHRHSDIYGSTLSPLDEFRISRDPVLAFSDARYDAAVYERTVLWVTEQKTHSTIVGCRVDEHPPNFLHVFLLVFFMIGGILVFCLSRRLHHTFIFWVGIGIFYGICAGFLEECITDSGTVFLVGGTPMLSLFTTLYTSRKMVSSMTACSAVVIAHMSDILRVPWGTSQAIMGVLLIVTCVSISVLSTHVFLKPQHGTLGESGESGEKIKPQFCPQCGKKMKPGWNMCPYCKSDLDFTRVYDGDGK